MMKLPIRILPAVAVIFAGCGGGGGGVTPPRAPTIKNAAVNPATLRFTGGAVQIRAEVTDASGVAKVWAVVTKGVERVATVKLVGASGELYAGSWTAPANAQTTGAPVIYRVRLHARSNAGAEVQSNEFTLTVEAAEAPPAEPAW